MATASPTYRTTDLDAGTSTSSDGSPSKFVSRVTTLPFVTTALESLATAYDQYGRKSSLPLVAQCLESVETNARPIVDKGRALISTNETFVALDSFALTKLEQTIEFVSQNKEGLETRAAATQGKVLATTGKLVDTTLDTLDVARASAQKLESLVSGTATTCLSAADSLVDRVLPATAATMDVAYHTPGEGHPDGEVELREHPLCRDEEEEGTPKPLGAETLRAISKCRGLTTKVRVRIVSKAFADFDGVKARSTQAIDGLKQHTVDLIAFAATMASDAGEPLQEEIGEEVGRIGQAVASAKLAAKRAVHSTVRSAVTRVYAATETTCQLYDAHKEEIEAYTTPVRELVGGSLSIARSRVPLFTSAEAMGSGALSAALEFYQEVWERVGAAAGPAGEGVTPAKKERRTSDLDAVSPPTTATPGRESHL